MSALPDVGDRMEVPVYLLSERPQDEHYVLRVVGESMIEGGIQDGDFIVLRRTAPEPGELVIALVGDDSTIKHFYPEGELVRLQPVNKRMDPIRIAARDVHVQGVVVGLIRKYKSGRAALLETLVGRDAGYSWCRWPGCEYQRAVTELFPHSGTCPLMEET